MKKYKIIITAAGFFILYSCASKLYMPQAVNVEKARTIHPDITLDQIKDARRLYVTKCSSCHNLHLPAEFTAAQWKKNLNEMQPRAKISDEQKQLLYTYLTSE